jgi:hypothetical protein
VVPGGSLTISATAPPTLPALRESITGTTQLTITPALLESIEVTPPNPQLTIGTTQQFTATGLFTDNSTQDLTTQVTWQSSNTSFATISNAAGSHGLVQVISRTIGADRLTISATAPPTLPALRESITGTTQLIVLARLIQIVVSPANAQLAVGTTQQFDATGFFDLGTFMTIEPLTTQVTWQSSNPALATISNAAGSQGLATGVAPGGPIFIRATFLEVTGTATLTIERSDLVPVPLPDIPVPLGFCDRDDGSLRVTVRNQGNIAAPISSTTVVFTPGGPQIKDTPAIPAGGSVVVLFDFPSGCFDNEDCDFSITVDSDTEINESDEQNNVAIGNCFTPPI